MKQKVFMTIAVSLLILFNYADCVFTLYFLEYNQGSEVNPLMKGVINFSPALFVLVKGVIGTAAFLTLWYRAEFKTSRLIAGVSLLYYSLLIAYFSLSLLIIEKGWA